MEKRDQVIHFRLTKSEKEELLDKAQGNISDWIRDIVFKGKPKKTKKAKPVNPELLYELNKIGVNLNQIAKAINSKPDLLDQIDLHLILISIDTSLKKIREVYS